MTKKWILLVVAVLLVGALLLPACGGDEPAPAPAPAPAPTTAPSPAPTTAPSPAPTTAPSPAPTTAPAPAEELGSGIIKFSYTMPKGASMGAGFEWFAEEFTARTDGRYKVETYPAQTLTKIPVALDAVKGRVAEIIGTSCGTFERDFPLSNVAGLPWLGWPLDTVEHALLADQAFDEFIMGNPAVWNEYKDFKLLQAIVMDSYCLFGNKDIRKAADFNGAKIGGSGPKMEVVKANGGAAVHMIPPQSYINLDKGTVDNAFLTYSQVKDYKLTEVCDYFYNGDFGCGTYLIMMNWEAFNEMAPSDQKLIEDTWEEALEECIKGSMASMIVGKETIAEAGISITEPTEAELEAWITDSKPAVDYWVETSVSAGIADPLPYLEKWEALRDKYLAMH